MERFIIDETLRWVTKAEMKPGTWCNAKVCPFTGPVVPLRLSDANMAFTGSNGMFIPCLIVEQSESETVGFTPFGDIIHYKTVTIAFRDIFGDGKVLHLESDERKLRALHPLQVLRMTAAGKLIKKYLLRWREHVKYKIGSENYNKAKTEFYSLS